MIEIALNIKILPASFWKDPGEYYKLQFTDIIYIKLNECKYAALVNYEVSD